MSLKLELTAEKAGLCLVDIQERLAGSIPEKVIKGTLRNCLNLIEAARIFGMPIAVTEHFSNALGRSLPVIVEAVLRLDRSQVFFLEKLQFCGYGLKPFDAWIKGTGRMQWICSGMETHVSIYQTARAMAAAGLEVHVPRDAVVSRTMANWEIGLQLIERAGGVITSTETVIFDLLKQGGTDAFTILSRIIK
jgi:nicotinamidase-related amidase